MININGINMIIYTCIKNNLKTSYKAETHRNIQ